MSQSELNRAAGFGIYMMFFGLMAILIVAIVFGVGPFGLVPW